MTTTPGVPTQGRPTEPAGPNTIPVEPRRDGTGRGAVAIDDRPRRKGLLWLLLGLLLLALLALLLYALLHKSKKSDSDATPAPAASASAAAPSAAAPPANVLTSGGASLLPLTPAVLAAHAGQPVTGTAVVVQAPLAPKDGIFVGDSASDAIFLDLADPLPGTPTAPLTPYQPGQKVSFTAKLLANTPAYLAEAQEDGIPNLEQIKAQGYHLEAVPTDVKAAG